MSGTHASCCASSHTTKGNKELACHEHFNNRDCLKIIRWLKKINIETFINVDQLLTKYLLIRLISIMSKPIKIVFSEGYLAI